MPFIGFVSFYSTVDEVWSLHREIEVKYYGLGLNTFGLISLWGEADSALTRLGDDQVSDDVRQEHITLQQTSVGCANSQHI